MRYKHFVPLPREAILTFGGYSCINPDRWEGYLNQVIEREFPDFLNKPSSPGSSDAHWRKQESCVLSALEEYLFKEYGILIPEDNLFKIYNEKGDGLRVHNLIEAIAAVVEPLGLEIDMALAVDAEVRDGLGRGAKIVGKEFANQVHGKPGICMIQIEPGYSHAFYWPSIDKRGFEDEKFRLVVLVKRIDGSQPGERSAIQSASDFLQFFEKTLTDGSPFHHQSPERIERLRRNCVVLRDRLVNGEATHAEELRAEIEAGLVSLLDSYLNEETQNGRIDRSTLEKVGPVYVAGQLVRKVFREVEYIH